MSEGPIKGDLSTARRRNAGHVWARARIDLPAPADPPQPPQPAPMPAPKHVNGATPKLNGHNGHNGHDGAAPQLTLIPDPIEMPARAGIPFVEIVAAYHRHLADNPRVRVLSEATKAAVRCRWNEDKARQDVDWWDQYFAYAADCPWLVGKGNANTPFYADFAWLIGPRNMEKVINGRYAKK